MLIITDDGRLVAFVENELTNATITATNGKELMMPKTNIKKVYPITYIINSKMKILYYLTNEVKKRRYFIPNENKDFSLPELKEYLRGVLK